MTKHILILLFSISMTAVGCSQTKNNNGAWEQNKKTGTQSISEYLEGKDYSKYSVATFAGGCFWCTEAAFDRINGVVDVISGYSGGHTQRPTYEETGTGKTGHTESIQIYFDPEIVSFETLLEVLVVAHDPTQVNGQGADIGPEYRSAIFYHGDEQKKAVEQFIKKVEAEGRFSKPLATEVKAYEEFWVAEEYHQNYYEHSPENPYVQRVSKPKVEKVKKKFANILKRKYQ